jgi:hypothetical protein
LHQRLTDDRLIREIPVFLHGYINQIKSFQMIKFSETPTNTIAISARTTSDWDNVNCAILSLDNEAYLTKVKSRIQLSTSLKDVGNLKDLSFWDSVDKWLLLESDDTEKQMDMEDLMNELEEKDWCFVEYEDDETDEKPDQTIDAEQMKIDANGLIQFVGYGKHTSEEFWTSSINLIDVLNQIKQPQHATN